VGVEPYAFNLVSLIGSFSSTELDNYASIIYALDMGALMIIMAFFSHALSIEEKGLVNPAVASRYRLIRNILLLSGGLFLFTVLPQFWVWTIIGVPIRFYFWLIALSVSYVRRAYQFPREKGLAVRNR
jgi:hypothetical protein